MNISGIMYSCRPKYNPRQKYKFKKYFFCRRFFPPPIFYTSRDFRRWRFRLLTVIQYPKLISSCSCRYTCTCTVDVNKYLPTWTCIYVQCSTYSHTCKIANLCSCLWTPAYTPADRLTSWGVLYHPCTVPVYISCYLSDNKPVLSYLLSRLLPHVHVCTRRCTWTCTCSCTCSCSCSCLCMYYGREKCCRHIKRVPRYLTNEEKKIFYLDVIQWKTRLKIAFCAVLDKNLRKMHKIAIFRMGFL